MSVDGVELAEEVVWENGLVVQAWCVRGGSRVSCTLDDVGGAR